MKRVKDLTQAEVLALAVSSEEEDSQIYMNFAHKLRGEYASTAAMFEEMAAEEQDHKNMLLDLYRKRFGQQMPYITRQDVRGFMKRRPIWLMDNLRVDAVRRQAEMMEIEAGNFYAHAAEHATDVEVRKLLGDLALIEKGHEAKAAELESKNLPMDARAKEDREQRKMFILQIVQPGLAGLIDGSISTLAPIFAAAFVTHNSHDALVVGLAASIGAGISMGITESVSDDGAISGRGHPLIRGLACGGDDDDRRAGAYIAVPDRGFPERCGAGRGDRGDRAGRDCVGAVEVYGDRVYVGDCAGGAGRGLGAAGGDFDR